MVYFDGNMGYVFCIVFGCFYGLGYIVVDGDVIVFDEDGVIQFVMMQGVVIGLDSLQFEGMKIWCGFVGMGDMCSGFGDSVDILVGEGGDIVYLVYEVQCYVFC